MSLRDEIKKEMEKVGIRKPGRTRLVFRKETKTIWEVNQKGEYVRDTGLTAHED
jgi:hypothetical protein